MKSNAISRKFKPTDKRANVIDIKFKVADKCANVIDIKFNATDNCANVIDKKFNATDNCANATGKKFKTTDKCANVIDKKFNATDNCANATGKKFKVTDNCANATDKKFKTTDERAKAIGNKLEAIELDKKNQKQRSQKVKVTDYLRLVHKAIVNYLFVVIPFAIQLNNFLFIQKKTYCMNVKQNSIYSMLRRILAFLKKNVGFLIGFMVMGDLITRLENILDEMDTLKEQQGTDITGMRKHKEGLRIVATQKALEVCHGILAYAKMSGNKILAQSVDYQISDLNKLSDNDLGSALSVINTAAQKNQSEVANYNVSAEKIADMKVAIDAYKTAVGSPKDASIARKQVTDRLAILFDDAALLLEKIDLLMDTLKFTNTVLYAEYKANRKVFTHSGSLKAKVNVADSVTGMGLAGVRILFSLDKVVKLDKLTTMGGRLNIKSLGEGAYAVTVSKIGYITQNLMVNIPNSEYTFVDVSLVKETT